MTIHSSSVTICIVTYKRPKGLMRLLDGLNELEFTKTAPEGVRVVLVDNDQEGSGAKIGRSMANSLRWPMVVAIEPRRGIPYARNTAMSLVDKTSAYIAFIDDDEVPDPNWLDELLYVQATYSADVVTGPVIPYFPKPPPQWLVRGGFFDRPQLPDGSVVRTARTGNVLVRREVFSAVADGFDERLALTGGSDTLFFMQVDRARFKMVFAANATVTEWVPRSRTNAKWLLQRAFRIGNTYAICERSLDGSLRSTMSRWGVGVGLLVKGGCTALISVVLPSTRYRGNIFNGLRKCSTGLGVLAGLVGHRYEEYRRVHQV